MDWETFDENMRLLATMVNKKPDCIVAVVRGGIIPGRILASRLDITSMYCVNVRKDGAKRRVSTEIMEDLQGKHILVVEDVLETGISLQTVADYIRSKGAIVSTLALYSTVGSKVVPDYSLGKVSEIPLFPWE